MSLKWTHDQLEKILQSRILVLDGAMGTMLQRYRLDEEAFRGTRFADHPGNLKGNNDLLSLTQPDVVREIHGAYLDAGADIIETNTFNSSAMSQEDYGLAHLVYELNRTGAMLAAEMARSRTTDQKPRFVAGVLGPTNRTASLSPDVENPGFRNVTFRELAVTYQDAIRGLMDGGADILLIETVFDTLNAKSAIYAYRQYCREQETRPPLMISGTITDASGRTLSGQTPAAFCVSVEHADPLSVGLNCALGSEQMRDHLREIHRNSPSFVSIHPNAGLPDELGQYNESPDFMADVLCSYAGEGWVNIAGGCCGTTPDHIAAISDSLSDMKPRKRLGKRAYTMLSGLEPLKIGPESLFVNVGERTNVAGSRRFARLIREENYEDALSVARQQVENGAQMIDVNMDDAMLDAGREMARFLNMLAADPDIGRVPVMIDSSRFDVIESGLQCIQGKGVVNSISLKDGESVFLKHASTIQDYGAAVIVMAFDENGQAETLQQRLDILERAHSLLTKAGFPETDIIFDPNVYAIGTGIEAHDRYAVDYIEAVEELKRRHPVCLVSGGISNLSFSFRGQHAIREAMHAVFLYHAIRAGMDMGIVNAGAMPQVEDIPDKIRSAIEDLIFARTGNATDRLLAAATSLSSGKTTPAGSNLEWRGEGVEERLKYCIINGIQEYIQVDIEDALRSLPSAMAIIEGPLMAGMSVVGDRFGDGRMFLPQVVRSARVMKQAVKLLLPTLSEEQRIVGGVEREKPRIVMATVKGDVHDIGKNIVGVVMQCNDYEVHDLGVMVPVETILSKARELGARAIGLSGLITPSLEEMISVAREMKRTGMEIPLLIGGATTSAVHTAVKIEPEYDHGVIHVSDASRSIEVLGRLFSENKSMYLSEIATAYGKIRRDRQNQETDIRLLSLEEARARRLQLETLESAWKPLKPVQMGVGDIGNISIPDLTSFIDWRFFLYAWEIKGKWPDILSDPSKGQEARRLVDDAKEMLDQVHERKLLDVRAAWGMYPAHSLGDDIVIQDPQDTEKALCTFSMLRQQKEKRDKTPNLCLADFLYSRESGIQDYAGMFVTSAGHGLEKATAALEVDGDPYGALMLKILADRLAEACAEWLHWHVRTEIWGYASQEVLQVEDMLKERYQGIRPAPGYPPCPDHRHKRAIFDLLDIEERIGVSLTDNCMMVPAAAVCGFYLANPAARYFSVGRVMQDQLQDYARRTGESVPETKRWLRNNLKE